MSVQRDSAARLAEVDREKAGLLRRALDLVFGYDFFISYAWKDGGAYAGALTKRLEDEGFEVFLDRSDYAAGDDWKTVGAWTLSRTGQMILVGSPAALSSAPVRREIEIFARTGRRITPIDFDGTLDWGKSSSPIAYHLPPEILRINEPVAALVKGPSAEAIATIKRSFTLIRQDKKRARAFAVIAIILFVLALAALAFGLYAELQRRRAEYTIQTATASAKAYVKDVATSLRIAKGLPFKDVDRLMASAEKMLGDLARYDPAHPNVVSAYAMLLREKSQTALGRGETCEALNLAKESLSMLAGLPQSHELLEDLAFGHNRLGDAYSKLGRNEDAISQYREALKIRDAINDGGKDAVVALAKSYEEVGDALISTNNPAELTEAEALGERRLDLALRLVKENPSSPELEESLAKSYERLARIASERGQDTGELMKKILEIREGIASGGEKSPPYQEGLANIYSSLARSAAKRNGAGCSPEALAYHKKALAIRRNLVALASDNESRRQSLARTLRALSECGDRAENYAAEANRLTAGVTPEKSTPLVQTQTCGDRAMQ